MEILYKWRECRESLEVEEILNIALRVLEHINECDAISPYNIEIEDSGDNGILVNMNQNIEESTYYLQNVSGIAQAVDSSCSDTLERRFQFAFLIYYLITGEIKDNQFTLWKRQIRNGSLLNFNYPKINDKDQYNVAYELINKIIYCEKPGEIDISEIMNYIVGEYKPKYKIIFRSDITMEEIAAIDGVSVQYMDAIEGAVVTILEETGKVPRFLIHYDRIQELQQFDKYYLVENVFCKKYVVSVEEQICICYLRPKNWKEVKKDYESALASDALDEKEIAEVLDAYFETYKKRGRYLLIYAAYKGVIAYFDNNLLKRQVVSWNYMECKLEDRIEYMRLENEDIDSICVASSEESELNELIREIHNWLLHDTTKELLFTRDDKILSGASSYLDEMHHQLYKYYDLCLWSKDCFGKDVLNLVMEREQTDIEYEFTRQIGKIDNGEVPLIFYYVSNIENSFSYGQGKRKAFIVSVNVGEYKGNLKVKCMRDACGNCYVEVYTDTLKKLKSRLKV